MQDTSYVSPLRRWLESILVWYMLFMIVYLLGRFVVPWEWRVIGLMNNLAPYLFFPVVVGLVIALLLRSRRLLGLYFLVTLIGALWIGPPLAPMLEPTPTAGTSARVITFNVYPENPTLDEAVAWIGAYQPDILALQELPEDTAAFAAFDAAYAHVAVTDPPMAGRIYSQFPILETETIDLNEWAAQRVVVDINGTVTVVYNVHLIIPFNDRDANWLIVRYDESRRNAQIERLTDLVAAETDPVLLLGDLNMTEWSPSYGLLRNELNDSYRAVSWGTGATFPAGEGEELGGSYPRLFRIDYVWHSDEIVPESAFVGANLGSDHLPLVVELTIP